MLKRIYGVILILLILVIGCVTESSESKLPSKIKQAGTSKTTSSDFLVYENSDYGVKIKYPSNWQPTETEDVIAAFLSPKADASPDLQENLGLTMNDLAGQGLTLQKYNEVVIEQLKQTFPDIKILESGSTVLSNNPAHKVVFTASNLKLMQVWTIKHDLAYIWSFVSTEGSYADYLGTIQTMLDSFEITKNIRGETEELKSEAKASIADADPAFVGSWRIFSERIFYDIGGAGSSATPVTRNLDLLKDGTWRFGDSQGTWTVTEITSDDWARWSVNPYGPTRKIILDKWNKATADGPIEESKGYVDFIWVIYHVEPPQVQNAGTIWMKFGHS